MFLPGNKLSKGRPFGSKSQKTLLRVKEILLKKGINPIEKLLELLPLMRPKDQAAVWRDILGYVDVKRGTVAPKDADEKPDKPAEGLSTDALMRVLFKNDTSKKIQD